MRYIRVSKFYTGLAGLSLGWVVAALVRAGGGNIAPLDFGGICVLIMVALFMPLWFEKQ